jgi:hypothetical protein
MLAVLAASLPAGLAFFGYTHNKLYSPSLDHELRFLHLYALGMALPAVLQVICVHSRNTRPGLRVKGKCLRNPQVNLPEHP